VTPDPRLRQTYADLLGDGTDPVLARLIGDLDAACAQATAPTRVDAAVELALRERARGRVLQRSEDVSWDGLEPPLVGVLSGTRPDQRDPLRAPRRATRRQWLQFAAAVVAIALVAALLVAVFRGGSSGNVELGAPGGATERPAGQIAFVAGDGESFDIHIVNADGSGEHALTGISGLKQALYWSPSGLRVAFSSDRDGDYEIYVMDGDGQNLRQVTDTPQDEQQVLWSPDGKLIATVAHDDNGNVNAVQVAETDGSGTQLLTDWSMGSVFLGTWSPDGKQIVAHFSAGPPEVKGLSLGINVDGSGGTTLTPYGTSDGLPSWSPDGSQLVVASKEGDVSRFTIMNGDWTERRTLATPGLSPTMPVWSPDGSKIAFYNEVDRTAHELIVMNADGSDMRTLATPKGTKLAPIWSPDGDWIAFWNVVEFQAESFTLYVIRADGSDLTQPSGSHANWSAQTVWYPAPSSVATPAPLLIATPLPGDVRPPAVTLATESGSVQPSIGSYNWYSPEQRLGADVSVPYVILPEDAASAPTGSGVRFDVSANPFAVESIHVEMYTYADNWVIPDPHDDRPSGDISPAFIPQTVPTQQLDLGVASPEFVPSVPAGRYIVSVTVVWQSPAELPEPLEVQYVYLLDIVPPPPPNPPTQTPSASPAATR
jgi:Tol biopolymer transport system component